MSVSGFASFNIAAVCPTIAAPNKSSSGDDKRKSRSGVDDGDMSSTGSSASESSDHNNAPPIIDTRKRNADMSRRRRSRSPRYREGKRRSRRRTHRSRSRSSSDPRSRERSASRHRSSASTSRRKSSRKREKKDKKKHKKHKREQSESNDNNIFFVSHKPEEEASADDRNLEMLITSELSGVLGLPRPLRPQRRLDFLSDQTNRYFSDDVVSSFAKRKRANRPSSPHNIKAPQLDLHNNNNNNSLNNGDNKYSYSQKFDQGEEFEKPELQRVHLAKLNNAVRNTPTDERAWLTLVEYKTNMWIYTQRRHDIDAFSVLTRREFCVDLVAVLDSAIAACPLSEQLTRGRLSCIDIIHAGDPQKRQVEWNAAKASFPGCPEITSGFVNDQVNEGLQHDEIRSAFQNCFESIGKTRADAEAHTQQQQGQQVMYSVGGSIYGMPDPTSDLKVLDLISEFAIFETQAGYCEIGIGLLQALVEFNLGLPGVRELHPGTSYHGSFAQYWESEAARVGDAPLGGWAMWQDGQSEESRQIQTWVVPILAHLSTLAKSPTSNQHEDTLLSSVQWPWKHSLKVAEMHAHRRMQKLGSSSLRRNISNADRGSEEEEEEEVDDDGMIYSMMHGYKIPVGKSGGGAHEEEEGEDEVYQRTLQELHDTGREMQTRRAKVRDRHEERHAHRLAMLKYAVAVSISSPTSSDSDTDVATSEYTRQRDTLEWVRQEAEQETAQWQPVKLIVSQDMALDHPERVVMWEDVSHVVMELNSRTVRIESCLSFLSLLGMDVAGRQVSFGLHHSRASGSVSHTALVERVISSHLKDLSGDDALGRVLNTWQHNTCQLSTELIRDQSRQQTVRNVLVKLTAAGVGISTFTAAGGEAETPSTVALFGALWLAFETSLCCQSVVQEQMTKEEQKARYSATKEIAKHVLQTVEKTDRPRDGFLVWREYVALERAYGKSKRARQTCDAAMGMVMNMAATGNSVLEQAVGYPWAFVFDAVWFRLTCDRKPDQVVSWIYALMCGDNTSGKVDGRMHDNNNNNNNNNKLSPTNQLTCLTRLRQVFKHSLIELARELHTWKENDGAHVAESVVMPSIQFDCVSAIGCEAVFHMACDTGNGGVENALLACSTGLKATRETLPNNWATTIACIVRLHLIRLSIAHWARVPGERVCTFAEEALSDCPTHPALLACLVAGLRTVPRSHLLCTWFDRNLLLQDSNRMGDSELLVLAGQNLSVGSGQRRQQRQVVWAFGVLSQVERALRGNSGSPQDVHVGEEGTFRHWMNVLLGEAVPVVTEENYAQSNGSIGDVVDSSVETQGRERECQRRVVMSRIREWLVLATNDRDARKNRLFWGQLARLELQDGRPDVCKQVMIGAIQSCSSSKRFWLDLVPTIGPLLVPTSFTSQSVKASINKVDHCESSDNDSDNPAQHRVLKTQSDELQDLLDLAESKGIWWRVSRP